MLWRRGFQLGLLAGIGRGRGRSRVVGHRRGFVSRTTSRPFRLLLLLLLLVFVFVLVLVFLLLLHVVLLLLLGSRGLCRRLFAVGFGVVVLLPTRPAGTGFNNRRARLVFVLSRPSGRPS